MPFTLYKIVNRATGRAYVGITKLTAAARWTQHKKMARNRPGHTLHRAIRKYGAETFDVQILETIDELALALHRERELIVLHGTLAPSGYNLTSGGESSAGVQLSEQAKANLRASMTPERNRKISEALKGRKFSPETLALMSANRKGKGRPCSEAAREKHRQRGMPECRTPEAIAKMQATRKGWRASPELRARLSALQRGKPKSPAHVAAVAAALRARAATPEGRAALARLTEARLAARRARLSAQLEMPL
jgi:group I intron endonuclease